jgi:hypothetical protein
MPESAAIWKFKDIDHCEIINTKMGDSDQPVLIIESHRGKRTTLGIAPSVSVDEIQVVLKNKNVKVIMNA